MKLRLTQYFFTGNNRRMTLDEWLTAENKTLEWLADQIGTSIGSASRMTRGLQNIPLSTVSRIEALTGGKVSDIVTNPRAQLDAQLVAAVALAEETAAIDRPAHDQFKLMRYCQLGPIRIGARPQINFLVRNEPLDLVVHSLAPVRLETLCGLFGQLLLLGEGFI